MQRIDHPLLSGSLGSFRTLTSVHFGQPGAAPRIYIEAGLHDTDEMLDLHSDCEGVLPFRTGDLLGA